MLNLDKIFSNIENLASISKRLKRGETHRVATHADCPRESRGKSFKPVNPAIQKLETVLIQTHEKWWSFSKFVEDFQDKVHWFHGKAPWYTTLSSRSGLGRWGPWATILPSCTSAETDQSILLPQPRRLKTFKVAPWLGLGSRLDKRKLNVSLI